MTATRRTKRQTTRLKRSKLDNLFRHASGVYWVRVKVNGKSKERFATHSRMARWINLRVAHPSRPARLLTVEVLTPESLPISAFVALLATASPITITRPTVCRRTA